MRVDRGEQPVEAVYAQHSGGERCGWPEVRTRGDAPVAYLANGSHAAYFRPGVRDRTFPDPNDEARGHGSVIRPRLVVIAADLPSWMRFTGRWGASRARLPFEQSSPRGPAFQGVRWRDPAAFAASARSCMAGRCDEVGECDPPLGSKLPGLAPRWRESALGGARSASSGCWPASPCGGGAGELRRRRCARGRPGRRVARHPAPPRGRPGRIGTRGASSTTRLTSTNGRDREKVRRYPLDVCLGRSSHG